MNRHAIVLGAIFAAVLFGIWFFEYLPMVDLPEQMFAAKVLTHYDDANTAYSEFFTKRLPWNPYSSYFWLVTALQPVIGIANATRLYISLGLILTIIAFGVWLREVRPGHDALMIPATLFLFSFFFFTGFINFTFSVPFMFFALALGARLGRAKGPTWKTESGLALALLVIYFSHVVTFVITLLVIGVQQLVTFRGHGLVKLLRAAAPSVAIFAIYMLVAAGRDASGSGWSYDPFQKRLEYLLLPFNVYVDMDGRWVFHPRNVLSWLAVGIVALAAGRGKVNARRGPAALVAIVLVATTLFFPSLVGGSYGALRISYPAAFALLALMPVGWADRKVLRWLVVVICIANPLWVAYRLVGFQKELASFEQAIAAIPERQVVQPVITELHSENFRTYPFLHIVTWYNYHKGGTNPYLFARVGHFPIREKRQPIKNSPGEWKMANFRYDQHQEGTDYFLVRTQRTDIVDDIGRHVPLVARAGDWMVFGPNPTGCGWWHGR